MTASSLSGDTTSARHPRELVAHSRNGDSDPADPCLLLQWGVAGTAPGLTVLRPKAASTPEGAHVDKVTDPCAQTERRHLNTRQSVRQHTRAHQGRGGQVPRARAARAVLGRRRGVPGGFCAARDFLEVHVVADGRLRGPER